MWLPLTAPRSLVTGDCTETPITLPTILAVLQHAGVQSGGRHTEKRRLSWLSYNHEGKKIMIKKSSILAPIWVSGSLFVSRVKTVRKILGERALTDVVATCDTELLESKRLI